MISLLSLRIVRDEAQSGLFSSHRARVMALDIWPGALVTGLPNLKGLVTSQWCLNKMLVGISACTLLVHFGKGLLKEICKVTVQEQLFLADLGQEAQGALCCSLDTALRCHKPVDRDGCTGPEDSWPGALGMGNIAGDGAGQAGTKVTMCFRE